MQQKDVSSWWAGAQEMCWANWRVWSDMDLQVLWEDASEWKHVKVETTKIKSKVTKRKRESLQNKQKNVKKVKVSCEECEVSEAYKE